MVVVHGEMDQSASVSVLPGSQHACCGLITYELLVEKAGGHG